MDFEEQDEEFCARLVKSKEVLWQHQLWMFEENRGMHFASRMKLNQQQFLKIERGLNPFYFKITQQYESTQICVKSAIKKVSFW